MEDERETEDHYVDVNLAQSLGGLMSHHEIDDVVIIPVEADQEIIIRVDAGGEWHDYVIDWDDGEWFTEWLEEHDIDYAIYSE